MSDMKKLRGNLGYIAFWIGALLLLLCSWFMVQLGTGE
jgi:hypothetical protein